MGMINLGSIFKSIGSGIKALGQTALQAIAPAATDLLKNIVGSGFDAFKGAADKFVSNLPGPLGSLAQKYLAPLMDKGIESLKGMSENAISSLIKSLVEKIAPRAVPGAPAGSAPINLPALGTPARQSGSSAATGAFNNTVATSAPQVSGQSFSTGSSNGDMLANGAAGADRAWHAGGPDGEQTPASLDKMTEGQMIAYQQKMQQHARLMDMYTKLIQADHDTKKNIIGSFRV